MQTVTSQLNLCNCSINNRELFETRQPEVRCVPPKTTFVLLSIVSPFETISFKICERLHVLSCHAISPGCRSPLKNVACLSSLLKRDCQVLFKSDG